jgi:dethiobiotin synthetase
MSPRTRVLVVTAAGTGVGKTVVTAAIAACARAGGRSVAVVKPSQTGVAAGEDGDLAEVARLSLVCDLWELARFAEPLAPATAARKAGVRAPAVSELAERIVPLSDRELVVVEGSGGVLVHLNDDGQTLLDLVLELESRRPFAGSPVEVVLVSASGLGALNSAALCDVAIRHRLGRGPDHLVLGNWPACPALADRCNLLDFPRYTSARLAGAVHQGAPELSPAAFAAAARAALSGKLGGSFEPGRFIAEQSITKGCR